MDPALAPYDGVLLQSFGGPERPQDVLPFLRNVTAGRGIPDERLAAVAEHYHHFGGRSPINDQNRALLAALRAELDRRDLAAVPLLWGNRNWEPYLTPVLEQAHRDGLRRLVSVPTSAYSSYSGCRQYREDLGRGLVRLAQDGRGLEADRIRHYFNHPGFLAPVAEGVVEALDELAASGVADPSVLFVTHSVPLAMNDTAGPDGGAYLAQHLDACAGVVEQVRRSAHAADLPWELTFCSRSGPASQPWLEPDVGERIRELAAQGVAGVVVVPIGFVSDHMEVVYDLDTEAAQVAAEVELAFVRSRTVGDDPRFVSALVDLLLERAALARGQTPPQPSAGAIGPWSPVCAAGCCPNPRPGTAPPAACGQDWAGAQAWLAAHPGQRA